MFYYFIIMIFFGGCSLLYADQQIINDVCPQESVVVNIPEHTTWLLGSEQQQQRLVVAWFIQQLVLCHYLMDPTWQPIIKQLFDLQVSHDVIHQIISILVASELVASERFRMQIDSRLK